MTEEKTIDNKMSYFFCYECGSTLTELSDQICPVCLENEILSWDFGMLSPLSSDKIKGPHISLALMDPNRDIWWDEVVETEEGYYLTLVRLPKNCGFIPRWLVDFQQNALLDPVTRENAIRVTLQESD